MITLWGMMKFEPKLFDGVPWPGQEVYPAEIFVRAITDLCGESCPYYQDVGALKQSIYLWGCRRGNDWQRMYLALNSEYNPIENYNRYDDFTETPNITKKSEGNGHSGGRNRDGGQNISTNAGAAFNTPGMTDRRQDTFQAGTWASTTAAYVAENTETETGTRRNAGWSHGNIGVSTTQNMVNQEITLRTRDWIKDIAREFEREFMIRIY